MPKEADDELLAISLIKAIEHGHVPIDEDDKEEKTAEWVVIGNDPKTRDGQRATLVSLLEEIDGSVKEIDNEIQGIVENVLDGDFEPIRDIIKNLAAEVQNVTEMYSQVQNQNAIASTELSDFSEIYEEYETLLSQQREFDSTIAVLADLEQWRKTATEVENALESGDLDNARSTLDQASKMLVKFERQTQMIAIVPKMKVKEETLTAAIKDAFILRWNEMVSLQENKDETILAVTEDTNALDGIISNLISFNILQPQISLLTAFLREKYIQPLLSTNFTLSAHPSLSISKSTAPQSPEQILKHLASLVTFLSTSLPLSIQSLLIPHLLPSLTTNLITDFLPSHIPQSITDLATFDVLLDSITQFDTHLVNLEWATQTPLSLWVAQAPRVWFMNRQAAFLSETREFILKEGFGKNVVISSDIDITLEPKISVEEEHKGELMMKEAEKPQVEEEEEETDGWGFDAEGDENEESSENAEEDNWKWEDDIPDEEQVEETHDEQNSDSFPYSLSGIPDGLLEIVQRILDEGAQLQFSEYAGYAASNCATEYPSIVSTVMALWRAIGQLQAHDLMSGQRMRLSNEALYLSHRLVQFTGDRAISAEIHRLMQCGNHWFSQELGRTMGSLSMILTATNGFENSSHPEQSQKCTNAIQVVKREILSLSEEYTDVLPPQKRRIAIGEILSSVLSYINTSLTLMDDISADESTFLITLYIEIFTLEDLFHPLEPGLFCPEWLRAQYIRELLEWRMVDIMESWREGLLQGVFSKEEMVGWLRKLFQDSDTRTRNIAEIQRG